MSNAEHVKHFICVCYIGAQTILFFQPYSWTRVILKE